MKHREGLSAEQQNRLAAQYRLAAQWGIEPAVNPQKKAAPKKKHRVRKTLCAAFAAATLLGGGLVAYQHYNSASRTYHVYYPGPEPGLIHAFGETAKKTPQSLDPYGSNWNAIPSYQQYYMNNAADARGYRSYLAMFDKYKGETLVQMANDVNATVQSTITYSDTLYGPADTYWAPPIQTEMYGKGDCKDQAVLQYYIMLHLGVPEDRLSVAGVDASPKKDNYPDHAVLLLNTAPAGQPQSFVVLNDGGPVVDSNAYEQGGTVPGWPQNYVFYEARNQKSFWATKYSIAVTPAKQVPSNVKSGPKPG